MTIHIPIENEVGKYLDGFGLDSNSTTLLNVLSGKARDSTGVNFINTSATITINTAINGAGGLDQGTIANSTLYAVHVIGDSSKNNASSAIISTSATSPLFPLGYDMFRRVGWVLTTGAAALIPFLQSGDGSTRRMTYDDLIQVLSAGVATTFTDVDASGEVPSTASGVILQCSFTPATAGTNQLKLRVNASSAANGSVQVNGTVNAVVSEAQVWVPMESDGIFEYLVSNASDAATIKVSSYDDVL